MSNVLMHGRMGGIGYDKMSAHGETVGEMCRWVCDTKGMGMASMRCDSWCMMTRVMVSLR